MQYKVYEYRWIVLAVYMYMAALTQLYWLNFAAITTYIEARFKIPASDVMWLTLVFPLIGILLSLPAGILIDKKGYKYGVGVGAIFTGVFSLFRLIDPGSFTILLVSQIGIAIGLNFIMNGITKLVVTWFAPKEEATAIGLGSLALFIGMMIGLGATPWLVETLGFEYMLLIYGIMGIFGILVFFIFTKSGPPTPTRAEEIHTEISNWGSIRDILKVRNFVILSFVAMTGLGVFNGLATWLEKILHDLHGISMTDAGIISAVLILSGMVGCIVIPMISDKIRRRKIFLILTAVVGIICVSILMFANAYIINLTNCAVIGFFLLSALPIIYTMSAEITGPSYAGVSVGYIQFMGNIAAVILVTVMEGLSTATGNFIASLILLIVLMLALLIMSILIKDTRPDK